MPDQEQLDDFLEALEEAGSPGKNPALCQALRGLFGTCHGQHGSTTGLTTRHAKLAVGAASMLAVFSKPKSRLSNPISAHSHYESRIAQRTAKTTE